MTASTEPARWPRRLGPLYPLAVALQFLTRIPMPRTLDPRAADLAAAAVWFPVVGLLVGGALGGAAELLLLTALAPGVAAVLLVVAAVLVTGAFHEDGLADTADGIGGGFTREKRLSIMRDSRVGSYGALALVLVIVARFACLLGTQPGAWAAALIASHTIGRCSTLVPMKLHPYARDTGAGKPVVEGLSWAAIAVAGAITLAVALVAGRGAGLAGLAAAAVLTVAFGAYARRRLGGVTGDVLGAGNVLCEVAVLVAFAAAHPAALSPWVGG